MGQVAWNVQRLRDEDHSANKPYERPTPMVRSKRSSGDEIVQLTTKVVRKTVTGGLQVRVLPVEQEQTKGRWIYFTETAFRVDNI